MALFSGRVVRLTEPPYKCVTRVYWVESQESLCGLLKLLVYWSLSNISCCAVAIIAAGSIVM